MGMDRDPNRILGYIHISSKLRRLDRSLERPGFETRGNLVALIGLKSVRSLSVDIPTFSASFPLT